MGKTIKDLDIDLRPREKMEKQGYESLADEELLAILLATGSKNKNSIELAREILEKFTYDQLLEISIEELYSIKGIKLAKASKIVAAIQFGKRLSQRLVDRKINKITSNEDVYKLMKNIFVGEKKEHFYAILLDTKNDIISRELISTGDLNSTVVNPREVFKPAVKKSANALILVHNHPSGNCKPSVEDINITNRLKKAGDILSIKVLDHVIIGFEKYYSMKRQGDI